MLLSPAHLLLNFYYGLGLLNFWQQGVEEAVEEPPFASAVYLDL